MLPNLPIKPNWLNCIEETGLDALSIPCSGFQQERHSALHLAMDGISTLYECSMCQRVRNWAAVYSPITAIALVGNGPVVTVLHGTYLADTRQFLLWGEGEPVGARPRGRKPRLLAHPFGVSLSALTERALALAQHIQPQPITATLWLPGNGHAPQPSPELVAIGIAAPVDTENLALRAWKVDSIALNVLDALDVLLSVESAAFCGQDIIFWRTAALYALGLVAGQQVIPALERDGLGLRAMWKPQPEKPELLAALAERMPPVCRAAAETPDSAPAPTGLLNAFVEMVVDQAVRGAARSVALNVPRSSGGKWLAALTGEDNRLALQGVQADDLFHAWQTWVGTADMAGNAAFRITFRLDAPAKLQGTWALHYLLQATDDPSLIVSAGQIWRGRSDAYLQRRFEGPQERLLAGLGFAARLFPPIKDSLRGAAPEGAAFDADQAFTFLKDVAPLLQGSGFRVLLPRWWGGKQALLTARAKLKGEKMPNRSILTLETLVNYEWQVMLGGQPISKAEFQRLAALKQPLVLHRGQWVSLDPAQIAAGLAFFDRADGQVPLGDAVRLGLDESEEVDGLPLGDVKAAGWLKTLLDTLQKPEKIEALAPPDELHGELRPYQQRGYAWLAFLRRYGLGACLADDMGLGKSIQAMALLLHERRVRRVRAPALLVCPTSVVGNWRRELARFAPDLGLLIHHGTERAVGEDFSALANDHDLVLTSYPLLARDRAVFAAVTWSIVILDEAQNIKNSATKQSQAARALKSSSRIALTGTPVENRLGELWSIFQFLNPDYLGSEQAFRKRFAGPIERLNDADAARRLRRLTGPFILRRLKTDPAVISDLPDKLEMKVYCTLTTEQGTLYEAVVRNALARVEQAEGEGDAMARRGLVLSMLMQLKQVCNHPAQYLKDGSAVAGRSGKLARLTEMLEEVFAGGDRALVFTQFAEMGELLHVHLTEVFGEEPLWLHGGTPAKARDAMIARFQAERGPTVFLLSLKAGGVGLNLTRAHHVFHFDRWWNPAVENQATDRAFRIGQTHNVQVHKFICAGTLEEKIDEMIESKKALAERIVGADERWLTELSTGALRDLVQFRDVGG